MRNQLRKLNPEKWEGISFDNNRWRSVFLEIGPRRYCQSFLELQLRSSIMSVIVSRLHFCYERKQRNVLNYLSLHEKSKKKKKILIFQFFAKKNLKLLLKIKIDRYFKLNPFFFFDIKTILNRLNKIFNFSRGSVPLIRWNPFLVITFLWCKM